ncbi:MAG: YncE family protein [Clostridia bacterium]
MKVYISNYLSKSISILNYDTFKLEKEIKLEERIYPHHFCIDKEKSLIYIPSSNDGILYVLDLLTYEIIDNISIGGNLSQIALCKGELFISNEDSNSIYIIEQENLNPVGIISVDEMPHGFDFDEENDKLYVPCINSIMCIDTINKCIDKKIDTKFKAWHIKIDKKRNEIYTSTLDGKLVILDKINMDIKNIIDGFLLPVQICFNYSGKKVYIADLGYKNIRILNYETGEYLGCIEVNGNPQGLEISKNEELLFVSDTQRNTLKIYSTLNNELIKEVRVGKEPTTIICL